MVDSTALGALTIAVLLEGSVILGLLVSILSEDRRFWPPGNVSWKFWYYWGGSAITFAALAVVGYLDAGSFVFTTRLWDWIGTVLLVLGTGFAGWSGYLFRTRESFGLAGELHTGGPYRYSRNPQYVGMVGIFTGIALIVNATLLFVGFLPVFVWLWLLPRAEEPWLRDQFGEEYEAYRESVPRFLGIRSLK
ncbi:methyltransferase family protein [Halocatena pleomorpha]|nr:PEMT/PEM2 methyltransferase family protein [Halocatena pleomorpha]